MAASQKYSSVRLQVDSSATSGPLATCAPREAIAQAVQRGGELLERERKATAHVERGGRVVQAESEDTHSWIIKSGGQMVVQPGVFRGMICIKL